MSQETEYHDAMIKMLELIWGEGFMAPGGTAKVDELVMGLDLRDRRVLDIGSGLGGPACHLAQAHGALVTGVDIEAQLVDLATERAVGRGLGDRLRFRLVEPGPLPFDDGSFDLVISSGAFTQIRDKTGLFAEIWRVLEPGGRLHNLDWTSPLDRISDDLRYFFEMEGLTYALEAPETYERLLRQTGFRDIQIEDDTEWYRHLCRKEYESLKDGLNARMVELLGSDQAEHFIEDWRSMVVVFEKGELTLTRCRSRKPL